MASIIKEKNGRKTVQFVDPANKCRRPKIRLGKATTREAEFFKAKLERLIAAKITSNALDSQTAQWVTTLDDTMIARLAAFELVPKRSQTTLKAFLDEYFAKRVDVKPSTKINWRHTRRNLIGFFGPEKPLREFTSGDAKDWELYLRTEARDGRRKHEAKGLSGETVRKRCGNAKQFFNDALEHQLIDTNPFAKLKSAMQGNRQRDFFVTPDMAYAVLDACPDAQWRLLFALSRFGGLRCPSEHLKLTWPDVNWEGDRMTVHAPKTEHHPGRELRVIPIFPELRPYLEEVWEQAEPGTTHVITRYRDTNANLRTQLTKIIRHAGLEAWPKLFQNLRATRQTELEEDFPSHVVNAWIGNTQQVAEKHYLQVTDDHFKRASVGAVQNAVQYGADSSRIVMNSENVKKAQVSALQQKTTPCSTTESLRDGRTWIRTKDLVVISDAL